MRLGRQVARRTGVAALGGMKLAGSQTGHEQTLSFLTFSLDRLTAGGLRYLLWLVRRAMSIRG